MELTQIIYINQNKFTCEFVEKLCKQNDIACYTLDQVQDFVYLIDDLRPQIILVASDTFEKFEDQIAHYLELANHKAKLAQIDQINSNTFIEQLSNLL